MTANLLGALVLFFLLGFLGVIAVLALIYEFKNKGDK